MSASQGEVFLGRYHCLERLGSGPLGDTWRARIYGIGGFEKEFAVKRVPDACAADPTFVARLARAATAAAQLQTERVARVIELEAEDDRYYLIAELVRGIDLARLVKLLDKSGERLPTECALVIVLDAADALVYAHGRTDVARGGVLHLGLSPHGVMLDADGEVRLTDVGLCAALLAPGWTRSPLVEERVAFLAPEAIAGGPVDARADVYSLGAILRALAAGAGAGDPLAAACEPIAARALVDARDRRFPSVVELRRALEQLPIDRGEARRKLATLVMRYVSQPGIEQILVHAEPAPLPPPPPSDARERALADELGWDQLAPFEAGPVPDDALTNRVILPEARRPQRIPAPPTLPLSALRGSPLFDQRVLGAAGVALAATVALLAFWLWRGARPAVTDGARDSRQLSHGRAVDATTPRQINDPGSVIPDVALAIASTPPGARVFVDGVERGPSPLEVRVPIGAHHVALLADGRKLARRAVEARSGGDPLALELEPARLPNDVAGDARFKVRCQTRGLLRIFVDDADTGVTCPNEHALELATGVHRLSLYDPRTDQMIAVQKEIDLGAGERSTRVYLKY
ncbi:MAG TPA: protein kinase [Polyangia bacterium]|nr:protein kinase [Polyangia bacterium]